MAQRHSFEPGKDRDYTGRRLCLIAITHYCSRIGLDCQTGIELTRVDSGTLAGLGRDLVITAQRVLELIGGLEPEQPMKADPRVVIGR
jgi:hypothetical protein